MRENEKQLTVVTGPVYSPRVQQVVLNGVQASERLTPQLARRAVHAAVGPDYPATVWDHQHSYGYRVYARSTRKITGENGDGEK